MEPQAQAAVQAPAPAPIVRPKWAEEIIAIVEERQGVNLASSSADYLARRGYPGMGPLQQALNAGDLKAAVEAAATQHYLNWILSELRIFQFMPNGIFDNAEILKQWIQPRRDRLQWHLEQRADLRELRQQKATFANAERQIAQHKATIAERDTTIDALQRQVAALQAQRPETAQPVNVTAPAPQQPAPAPIVPTVDPQTVENIADQTAMTSETLAQGGEIHNMLKALDAGLKEFARQARIQPQPAAAPA